ncbi:hypothetical protein G5714_002985 [Onychostoma macrolepis]|uniref:Uncharacterized protein n=1 Tax=Onychostoma macrolepis TaxID=369639 RepID=A0A7J6D867_9TELE|nr:hypothetical protein G5714_002985 [Onychostoma macrolepis]
MAEAKGAHRNLSAQTEEGVDEESFTLDTNSKNFQRGDDGREDLTTSCGSVLKPFYVYDINYPKPFAPIREFLQHSL